MKPTPDLLIPLQPRARLFVDNDHAGDPDGLWALAHLLLCPTVRTVAISSALLDPRLAAAAGVPTQRTAALGQAAVVALLQQLGSPGRTAWPPVLAGAEAPGPAHDADNAAAAALVDEALRDDALPLWVACGGPLTNVAAALRLAPRIADRITLVWIGGTRQRPDADAVDEATEYNFATDAQAAREVLACAGLRIHQVPREAYRTLRVSVAELGTALRPLSPLADWLHGRYRALPPFVRLGGSVTFGDSALVLLCALTDALTDTPGAATDDGVRRTGPLRWQHTMLDGRLLLADLQARLRLQAAGLSDAG